MALLLDNDVVDKLAQLDLLPETKALLMAKFGQLLILDTLKHKLCPKKTSKRNKRDPVVISRIEDFIKDDIVEISCVIEDEDLLTALAMNPEGLDAGEMQLLQTLFKAENELLFTGDKRFLKALASADISEAKLAQVKGCFVCFEQIIYFLICELGFEQVKAKYLQALAAQIAVDTTLRFCFEGREQAVKERVIENLSTYIGYVRNESAELLSDSQDWRPV